MLPKPEKISKKGSKVEQPDMVDAIDNETKIRRKRQFIILILILTVGLSISFWFYRSIKSIFIDHNFPKINIPFPLRSNQNNSDELTKSINQILSGDKNFWSIIAKTLPESNTSFNWSKNDTEILATEKIKDVVASLSEKEYSDKSLIQSSLPNGAQIKENLISTDNSFEAQYLITIPQKEILLIIKITGKDLSQSKTLISLIAEKIYWQSIEF